jgi:hypothetical protein
MGIVEVFVVDFIRFVGVVLQIINKM